MPAFLKIMPVLLLTVAILMPDEVSVNIAGQRLYAYRIAWLVCLPWVLLQILRGALILRFNDLLVASASVWTTLSFVVLYGPAVGLFSGTALALDILLPYLVARIAIRSLQDFRRFLIVMAPVFLLFALLLSIEAISHTRFIRDGAASIFGGLGPSEFGLTSAHMVVTDTRYGMLRAMGPFSHPILAGLFFCSLLPLYLFSRLRGWPMIAGVVAGFAAIFSLSSAAMIGLVLGVVLAAYDWLRRIVVFLNWPIFMGVVGTLLLGLQIASQNGLLSVMIRMTFKPQSGYYRMLIWEYGSESVMRHPLFGIGYQSFEGLDWMGDSIDTLWLAVAVRNGLPPAVLLAFATIWCIIALTMKASRMSGPDKSTFIGFAITMTILFILGFTVSFFGGMLIWFVLLLGVFTTFGGTVALKQTDNIIAPRRLIT
jgi:hypothetical protein